jgi:hypothetical protein
VTKKFVLHLDALLIIILIFAISFGINLYQRVQYADLLEEYVEAETKAQNMEVNWNYVKGLLGQCQASQNTSTQSSDNNSISKTESPGNS